MQIVLCPGSEYLASSISSYEPGAILFYFHHKMFSDGESHLRASGELYQGLSNISGEEVGERLSEFLTSNSEPIFVISCMYPSPNTRFTELLFILSFIREYSSGEIKVIIPYLPYSRADRMIIPGDLVSHKFFLEILSQFGSSIVTLDVHNSSAFVTFTEGNGINVVSIDLFLRYIKSISGEDLLLISPDEGHLDYVKSLAERAKCDYFVFQKSRDYETNEVSLTYEASDLVKYQNRLCIIIDDIISSGGTLLKLIPLLDIANPKGIIVACTHGQFLGDSVQQLYSVESVREVVCTNSIKQSSEKVKVIEAISLLLDYARGYLR